MTKRQKKKLLRVICSALTLCIVYALGKNGYIDFNTEHSDEENSYVSQDTLTSEYVVTRVVDGDTFVVTKDGVDTKVRLIGVDTPESVHSDKSKNTEMGKTASEYTKEKLLNKQVKIELDVSTHDKYGRMLAYVYIDGQMYNKILLKDGMAQVATYPPNVKYVDDFIEIEKQARENKVGMWSDD